MTCSNHSGHHGCGVDYEQMLQFFETYISNALLCGKLQGGINACDSSTILPAGSSVVTCEQLMDLINDLLLDEKLNIPGIQSFALDGTDLMLVDQSGSTFKVPLASLLNKTVSGMDLLDGGVIKLTLKDGTEFKVDYGDYIAHQLSDAIAKVVLKEGTLDQDGNLVLTTGDGESIKVNMDTLKKVYIERDGPLTGDGSKADPLDVDFSRVCWKVIESIEFNKTGLVIQIANQCDAITVPIDQFTTVLNNHIKVCTTTQGVILGSGIEGDCLRIDISALAGLILKDETLVNNIANAVSGKVKVAVGTSITGDGTTGNPLNVKLSTDGGNLLSLRSNGLYYGAQASADISNLYIDPATGSDTNPGTRALPLKTLNKAIEKTPQDQSNTFWLRAGQEFVLSTNMSVIGTATRVIRVYGDPYIDGDKVPTDYPSPEVPTYTSEVLAGINRPTIRPYVSYNESIHVLTVYTMNPRNGGQIQFIGCVLDASPINDTDSGHPSVPDSYDNTWGRYNNAMIYGNQSGTAIFQGCKMRVPILGKTTAEAAAHPDTDLKDLVSWSIVETTAAGDVAALQFNHCQWPEDEPEYRQHSLIAMAGAGARVYNTGWPSNVPAINQRPGYENMPENLYKRFTDTTGLPAIRSVVRDSNGKPRNILTNFVL